MNSAGGRRKSWFLVFFFVVFRRLAQTEAVKLQVFLLIEVSFSSGFSCGFFRCFSSFFKLT